MVYTHQQANAPHSAVTPADPWFREEHSTMAFVNEFVSPLLKKRRGHLFFIMFFIALIFINLIFHSIFGEWGGGILFLMSLTVLVVGGLIMTRSFSQVSGKRWVVLSAVVLSIGITTLLPNISLGFTRFWIDYVRFHIHKEEYLSNVKMNQSNSPKFVRFQWGGFMFNPVELIFDESDELSFTDRAKSESWWHRAGKQSEFQVCDWGARKVSEHFYVVRFSC